MSGNTRYTKLTANEILPQVRIRLGDLREAYRQVGLIRASVARKASSNGGGERASDWAESTDELDRQLQWFTDRNIQVKDIDAGLIDFPATIDGQEVLLCWKDPEPEVAFWHTLRGGFAGRRPL